MKYFVTVHLHHFKYTLLSLIIIDTLGGNTFFSSLDMASSYWQVLVNERDSHKTAFTTKYRLYEHVRLRFGLCNSPATFSRVIQEVQLARWIEELS